MAHRVLWTPLAGGAGTPILTPWVALYGPGPTSGDEFLVARTTGYW